MKCAGSGRKGAPMKTGGKMLLFCPTCGRTFKQHKVHSLLPQHATVRGGKK